MGRSIRMITRQQEDTARPERMPAQAAAKTPGSNPKRQPSVIPYYSELEVLPHDAKPVTAQMTFAIDIDIANLIVQAFIGLVTLGALIAAFWQINQNKRNREYDIKRHQSSRISAWYDEGKNQIDRPKDSRFVWQLVVLRNESESPVYDVIVTCVGINGAGPSFKGEDNCPVFPDRACVGTLPPGAWCIWLPTGGSGMGVRTAPEVAFVDANGISWVRRGNGRLEEIPIEPAVFYRLPLPLNWRGCAKLTE